MPTNKPSKPIFEYKMLDNVRVSDFIFTFKKMDEDGWEFVAAIQVGLTYRMYFKREKE